VLPEPAPHHPSKTPQDCPSCIDGFALDPSPHPQGRAWQDTRLAAVRCAVLGYGCALQSRCTVRARHHLRGASEAVSPAVRSAPWSGALRRLAPCSCARYRSSPSVGPYWPCWSQPDKQLFCFVPNPACMRLDNAGFLRERRSLINQHVRIPCGVWGVDWRARQGYKGTVIMAPGACGEWGGGKTLYKPCQDGLSRAQCQVHPWCGRWQPQKAPKELAIRTGAVFARSEAC
jgi:hypothetical protein